MLDVRMSSPSLIYFTETGIPLAVTDILLFNSSKGASFPNSSIILVSSEIGKVIFSLSRVTTKLLPKSSSLLITPSTTSRDADGAFCTAASEASFCTAGSGSFGAKVGVGFFSTLEGEVSFGSCGNR